MTDLIFFSDPGHGWLEVSRDDLAALSLRPDHFSTYSYQDSCGERFYLEEDCDALRFIKAYRLKHDSEPRIVDASPDRGHSWIRRLPRINHG